MKTYVSLTNIGGGPTPEQIAENDALNLAIERNLPKARADAHDKIAAYLAKGGIEGHLVERLLTEDLDGDEFERIARQVARRRALKMGGRLDEYARVLQALQDVRTVHVGNAMTMAHAEMLAAKPAESTKAFPE